MNSIVISYHLKLYREIDVIVGMFREGLTHFHLRKPDLNINEYRELIHQIPLEYHNRIVIHSHFELLNELNLSGYYLTTEDRKNLNLPKNGFTKSTFVNSFEELSELDGQYDYFIMGSIFKSISKPGLSIHFKHDYLRTQFNLHKYQSDVLAIGGIKENTAEMAINYGFDGVVILGAVWALYMETFDIKQTVEKYVRINDVTMVMKN
jgi:thiamine-phosphate pyrophosphorylase